MNLLDENIRDDQRAVLTRQGIPFRQIGKEISRSGIHDENIIPLLHRLRRVTFFTQDEDFFKRDLCHNACALVYLRVKFNEVAEFVRRFLKHPAFNTNAKRMGIVAQVQNNGTQFWRKGVPIMQRIPWEAK